MRSVVALTVLMAALHATVALAVQLEALEPGHEWRLRALRFRGNHVLSASELQATMVTQPRPWYTVWRPYPEFDPVAFRTDIDRVAQLYRRAGYYHVQVGYDLELPAQGDDLVAVVDIDEGAPVYVTEVEVALSGEALAPADEATLRANLPVVVTQRFEEAAYQDGQTYLHAWYREHGFARVTVTRSARVDLADDTAAVRYTVQSGPASVFGPVTVAGTEKVDPDIVRREVTFTEGQPFKASLLETTRTNLLRLNLFRSLRLDEGGGTEPVVPIDIQVSEAPPREVRLGVGYDTDDGPRVLAAWRHYNFLGGGRQLGFSTRASLIRQAAVADFLQPHWPSPQSRTRLLFLQAQDEEDTFYVQRTRISPRIEWEPLSRRLSAYGFYRYEYDALTHVNRSTDPFVIPRYLLVTGIAPHSYLLSGMGFGVDANFTDDVLDPSRGWTATGLVEPVGTFLGGDIGFVRATTSARYYQPLPGKFLGAVRMRIGIADPLGATEEIPFPERFYAGGINSVRGYARWAIGPQTNFGHNPLGGRSLAELSVELRYRITKQFSAVTFLDGGQVSLDSFDLPFGDLQYGTGVGVRYRSPVGPLEVDIGFPIDRRSGDDAWQLHFSIGETF